MKLKDKVAIVTGGGNGIGRALCLRFHREGAAAVVAADLDEGNARRVAEAGPGFGLGVDVTDESQVRELVLETERRFGRVDLYCSNAGIFARDPDDGFFADNAQWQRSWSVNVMAHVYAARAVLPGMLKRGQGAFLITASAAGLLNQIGSAAYGVTKHAAVGFAENLAIVHGDAGILVSLLCPQAVRTNMTESLGGPGVAGIDGMLEPDQVAAAAVEGLAAERFLILPHPEVLTYFQRKTADYDRWLKGMRRLRDRFQPK